MIRVFLVDDHEMVLTGLKTLITEGADDMTVVGTADTVKAALARAPACKPDVAVLDVRLPDGDGVDLCRDLLGKLPDLACLMLSGYVDEAKMMDAVLAGAAGFIVKDVTGVDIVAAIRAVASGASLLDLRAVAVMVTRIRTSGAPPGPLNDLTVMERSVLDLLGEGETNRQIAVHLFLAEKTVKNYVSRLLSKLDVTSRTQAAIIITQVNDGVD